MLRPTRWSWRDSCVVGGGWGSGCGGTSIRVRREGGVGVRAGGGNGVGVRAGGGCEEGVGGWLGGGSQVAYIEQLRGRFAF